AAATTGRATTHGLPPNDLSALRGRQGRADRSRSIATLPGTDRSVGVGVPGRVVDPYGLEPELLHLLRRGLREGGEDLVVAGHHVLRRVQQAVLVEIRRFEFRPWPEHDAYLDVLFGQFAGQADGGGLEDVWVGLQYLFDFVGGDVLAAPSDGVGEPAVEGE